MAKKKVESYQLVCYVCGDSGSVPLMYVDPTCGAKEGRRFVPCPKCRARPKNGPVPQMGYVKTDQRKDLV